MEENNGLKKEVDQIIEKIKQLVKTGNVSRIRLIRNGEVLVNIPVTAGVIGAVVGLSAAPFAVIAAALLAFGLECKVEIEMKDGTVSDLDGWTPPADK